MEALIYIANVLYVFSYLVKDILYLRLLTITAACCLVVYFCLLPDPLMTVVYWNLFFVALNTFQIGRILHKRDRTGKTERSSVLASGATRAVCCRTLCWTPESPQCDKLDGGPG